MITTNLLVFIFSGLFSGILAGFLGLGGGTVLVPLLVFLGNEPIQAVATSLLAVAITATSGTVQNLRMDNISYERVLYLGLPAMLTVPLGAYSADYFSPSFLLYAFGVLLLINIYLFEVRKRVIAKQKRGKQQQTYNNLVASRIATGGATGLLAGFFGVGGGIIMVPLQILLLGESIKVAIQTSLGVIVLTSIFACTVHAINGNVLFIEGFLLGIGGLVGVQISTRFLPKLPNEVVSFAFRALLVILSIYTFWKASNL